MSNVQSMSSQDPLPLMLSACQQALNILEILERILFLIPPTQLLTLRFVSHHWDRATYRPIWQYPDFTRRGMTNITPRLVEHGHIVQELDFYKASLFREDPLIDVETLKRLCPNVRSLRMPYGCLTFEGVEMLIQFYGQKTTNYPLEKGGQLHTLSIDMSKTEQQPETMRWLTDLGSGLKRLELRLNRKREGSNRQRTSFLQFEPLLKSCSGLRELDIIPAPHFFPSSDEKCQLMIQTLHPQLVDSIHGPTPKFQTMDTLKVFEVYKPPLRRLHLARVWFSDMDLEMLGRACPGIDDLRLTNLRMDLAVNEWNIREFDRPSELEEQIKEELSIEVILKCWPGMRILRLDGNDVRMISAATRRNLYTHTSPFSSSLESDSVLSTAMNATVLQMAGLLPKGSYKLTSVCLYQTSLRDEDLMTLVDLVEPTLTYLNVDRNLQLTDTSIRHVFMTCSNIRDFSASELDITMSVFEDCEPLETSVKCIVEKAQGLHLTSSINNPGPATNRPWACIKSLRSLDLSWRMYDGRPAHLHHAELSSSSISNAVIPPYRHHAHLHQGLMLPPRQTGTQITVTKVPGVSPINQNYLEYRMFRKPWHIESLYERLRVLERLEILQLEGWLIPWRSSDIEAILGHSSEPELVSTPHQFQDEKIDYLPFERYKTKGRWVEMTNLKEYVNADFAYIATNNSIVKKKLSFQAPSKDKQTWAASPGVGGVHVDRANILPFPKSQMRRLKMLNIMCKSPYFMENPIGNDSPFVMNPVLLPENKIKTDGLKEEAIEGVSSSSSSSSLSSSGDSSSPPPPPPLAPVPRMYRPFSGAESGINPTPLTTIPTPTDATAAPAPKPSHRLVAVSHSTAQHMKPLAESVIASFMKACPNLERVQFYYGGLSYVQHALCDFTIQLGCSVEEGKEEKTVTGDCLEGHESTQPGSKSRILDDPALITLSVSPRRVLCTKRAYYGLYTHRLY
ncbi:hypothetical protein FBU30_000671 [Linnemannia zychae]|nr:hypothetical protein FBU30_000671 [Linnemannia zychae]